MGTHVSAFLIRRPCLDHGRMPTRVIATDNSKLSPGVAPRYTCMRIGEITRTHKLERRRIGSVISRDVRGPLLKFLKARGIGILGLGVTLRRGDNGWIEV